MKARLKAKEVDFVRHTGPSTLNVVGKKGEQRAQPGDVILITGATPNDREVIKATDFASQYDVLDDSGNVIEAATEPKPGDAYGVPHFDTIEEAQAAAQSHYAPQEQVEGDAKTMRPASTEPFKCTIGNTSHLYAVQPSGMVAQVPVAMQDSTADPGYATAAGVQSERYPNILENQGQTVREGVDGVDLPVSPYQPGAAEETPAQTFGNADNVPKYKSNRPDETLGGNAAVQNEEGTVGESNGAPHEEK